MQIEVGELDFLDEDDQEFINQMLSNTNGDYLQTLSQLEHQNQLLIQNLKTLGLNEEFESE